MNKIIDTNLFKSLTTLLLLLISRLFDNFRLFNLSVLNRHFNLGQFSRVNGLVALLEAFFADTARLLLGIAAGFVALFKN